MLIPFLSNLFFQLPVDTDPNLAADSDDLIPSQKAVKSYVDANAGSVLAILVSGGTQDGVYSKRGTVEGKDYFELLGVSDPDPGVTRSCYWNGIQFSITTEGGDIIYYSLSDVATPNLATNWKNASDNSPASIIVNGLLAR